LTSILRWKNGKINLKNYDNKIYVAYRWSDRNNISNNKEDKMIARFGFCSTKSNIKKLTNLYIWDKFNYRKYKVIMMNDKNSS
jgi:uncharacterized protein YpmS